MSLKNTLNIFVVLQLCDEQVHELAFNFSSFFLFSFFFFLFSTGKSKLLSFTIKNWDKLNGSLELYVFNGCCQTLNGRRMNRQGSSVQKLAAAVPFLSLSLYLCSLFKSVCVCGAHERAAPVPVHTLAALAAAAKL